MPEAVAPKANPIDDYVRPARLSCTPEVLAALTELGRVQCSVEEVACFLGFDLEVVEELFDMKYRHARRAYEAGRARGQVTLRQAQFEFAKTNAAMANMLGKIYLQNGERESDAEAPIDYAAAAKRIRDKIAAIVAEGASDRDSGDV